MLQEKSNLLQSTGLDSSYSPLSVPYRPRRKKI